MRKLLFSSFLVAILVLTSCARFGESSSKRARGFTFYVATNGNDGWSGTRSSANSRKSDGPFATIDRALREAGALKQRSESQQPVSIVVRGGTYWLDQPVTIKPELSGSRSAPLIIQNYRNERPILSGGKMVASWEAKTIAGKMMWVAKIPVSVSNGNFHQMWVDGERRIRARHPNKGYLSIESLPDASPTWENGNQRFKFKPGDLKAWSSATNGEAVAMTRWVESRLPIISINEKENLLTSSKRSVFQLNPGDLYYVENVFEALDEPGEWYFDASQRQIYYLPLPGETLEHFSAVIPRRVSCLQIVGDPASGKTVDYVQIRGLTFSHNEWFFPRDFGSNERHISTTPDPEIYGFAQAAFGVPGAVTAEGARNCSFENCVFKNIGSYGLQLGRGCQSNRVVACDLFDLGAGGIRIGETVLRTSSLEQAHDNVVTDCRIYDGGKMFHSGEGIWIGQSFGNHLAHNLIHDFFYTGISIGWTWGYEASLASNNIVEFNHVHHIGQKTNGDGPILSDMGGIYTLGKQPGTAIRNNLWEDIYGLRYGGWGIYFDEGSSGIVAENNVVIGTTHGGFHQHYGKENIVRNNIFSFARDHQLQRTRAEEHTSFTFEKNVVYFNQGKLLEGDWTGGKFIADKNLYFDTRTNRTSTLNFPGGWENWRKNGHDMHSVIADPLFNWRDPSKLKVSTESQGAVIGFQQINLKMIGPRTVR